MKEILKFGIFLKYETNFEIRDKTLNIAHMICDKFRNMGQILKYETNFEIWDKF